MAAHVRVVRPHGPRPHPVVLLLHGCGGLQPFMDGYAQALADAGLAAVIVDSFAPRGLSRTAAHALVCTGLAVRGQARAGDILALLAWLESEPWADAGRVALAGWSHGGWAVLEALALTPTTMRGVGLIDADLSHLNRVRAALLVYPYAGLSSVTLKRGWQGRAPQTAAILGGKDQVVGCRAAERTLARLQADGVAVETLKFPDATHAFDDDRASDPRSRWRPDYAMRSQAFLIERLKAALA